MYNLEFIITKWQKINVIIFVQIQKLLQVVWVTGRPLFLVAASIMYNKCLTLYIVWYILMSDVAVIVKWL